MMIKKKRWMKENLFLENKFSLPLSTDRSFLRQNLSDKDSREKGNRRLERELVSTGGIHLFTAYDGAYTRIERNGETKANPGFETFLFLHVSRAIVFSGRRKRVA